LKSRNFSLNEIIQKRKRLKLEPHRRPLMPDKIYITVEHLNIRNIIHHQKNPRLSESNI